MVSKIFLDANIVLDFLLQRDAGYNEAKQIMQNVIANNVTAHITPSIVHIAAYFLKKTHGVELTKKMLLSFLVDVKTIDIPFLIVQQALRSSLPDIEDSLQYYSALHYNMDYFISRDKLLKKFASPQLLVIHPKDFIKQYIA